MATGYITLTLEAYREGKSFVSRCRELDVASCGDSVDEAIAAIREATTDYLDAIEQLGERERIFAEKGIVVRKSRPRLPVSIESVAPAEFTITFVVPLPLAA